MNFRSWYTFETGLSHAAPRRVMRVAAVTSLLLTAAAMLSSPAWGQVKAPRYQSPIEAPKPQMTLPTPPAITPNGTVVEDAIVRVNDQIIDRSDYQRSEDQMVQEAQQNHLSPADLEQRQKDMLRDMIDQQLLLSRGKELEISADSEVIRRLDEIRKQNKLDSMEELDRAVRQSGVSVEDFKANIKNSVITQQVVHDEVGRTLRLTAKDEQAYYEQHKQEYEQPEQVRLSEILIPTPADATDAQIAQAKAKADEVATKLKAGASFEDLAKQYSGGQTADKGGDLGLFKRGALAKVLEDQTFPLKAGESAAPIRTRQGFVVLKVTEHMPAGVPPLKDVDQQVQEAMYRDAIQPALRTYLTTLREKAYIDIAPGFVDSGASPKQTKPVYAAYAPPVAKKKSVEQKQRLERGRLATATPTSATAGSTAVPGVAKSGDATATTSAAGSAVPPATGSATPPAASSDALTAAPSPAGRPVNMAAGKRPRKIRREKIRYGQAPRISLPSAPEETITAGGDQGPGATSSTLAAPGQAIAPIAEGTNVQGTNVADNADPLAPQAPERRKTRYSDRAPTEARTKAVAKSFKLQQKALAIPAPLSADEKASQQAQSAPLGLSGDTATKKKKKKVKGAPKQRLQEQPPAPPAARPEATPIPPKSIRDNGEPVVSPPPDRSTLPPVTAPAPGAPVDMQPSTPANPAPVPPQ